MLINLHEHLGVGMADEFCDDSNFASCHEHVGSIRMSETRGTTDGFNSLRNIPNLCFGCASCAASQALVATGSAPTSAGTSRAANGFRLDNGQGQRTVVYAPEFERTVVTARNHCLAIGRKGSVSPINVHIIACSFEPNYVRIARRTGDSLHHIVLASTFSAFDFLSRRFSLRIVADLLFEPGKTKGTFG